MKQIVAYNEEYQQIRPVDKVPDDANFVETFFNYMTDRATSLLGISKEEAKEMLNASDEELYYNVIGGECYGRILFGDCYAEHVALFDVPGTEDKDREIGELKAKVEKLTGILDSAVAEIFEGAEEDYAENVLDMIGTSEEELLSLGIRV